MFFKPQERRFDPSVLTISTAIPCFALVVILYCAIQETAQRYDVFQMPTFLFIRKGEVVEQFSGANAAVLRQKIEGLLGNEEGESTAVTEEGAQEQAQEDAAEQATDNDEGAAE